LIDVIAELFYCIVFFQDKHSKHIIPLQHSCGANASALSI
jgi:hypothetical protein